MCPSRDLTPVPFDDELFHRAHAMAATGRVVLGITGAPGAGKSTLAEQLVHRYGAEAVVVPMDGFHLHDDELARLELSHRKGAPETFDVAGYLALLRRLRTEAGHDGLRAGLRPVPRARSGRRGRRAPRAPAGGDRGQLPPVRRARLVATSIRSSTRCGSSRPTRRPGSSGSCERHAANGKPRDLAQRWATVSDQANAELVATTRERADVVVRVD